jgi:uncharacterized protein YdhG (YjbR/CyaY superfamily)
MESGAVEAKQAKPASVDEYIAQQPEEVRPILQQIRAIIREAAPSATEKISYGMPGYHLNGYLVGFAAWKQHIGMYPAPSGMEAFEAELARYKRAKGSVNFPLNEPMPYDLIRRIVEYRVAENTTRK